MPTEHAHLPLSPFEDRMLQEIFVRAMNSGAGFVRNFGSPLLCDSCLEEKAAELPLLLHHYDETGDPFIWLNPLLASNLLAESGFPSAHPRHGALIDALGEKFAEFYSYVHDSVDELEEKAAKGDRAARARLDYFAIRGTPGAHRPGPN